MPLKITLNGKDQWLKPQSEWTTLPKISKDSKVEVDDDFYVKTIKSNN
jgi:hypothetical protein